MHTFRHTPRHLVALVLTSALLLTAGACSQEAEPEPEASTQTVDDTITVQGTADEAPTLTYEKPYPYSEPTTEVIWKGEGTPVEADQPILLQVYAEDGDTGEVVRDDHVSVPAAYMVTEEEIGGQLYEALVGQNTGSRVRLVSHKDKQTLITVVDIVSVTAAGEAREAEEGQPQVTYGDHGAPTITIPKDTTAPTELHVQQLRTGRRKQVQANAQVVLQVHAVAWSTGEVFETTWGDGKKPTTVTVGTDELIEGLDQTLVGVPVGSQLLIVVPPVLGFGAMEGNELAEETLVYVIDVLAASDARE
ncbi:FKBP-type peptidyl-prolyl cis-trans isomerase [Jonesia quinghaiensis]|uniref:FKBP-type peptidyl-prolyl cis-trans isomerase n=1 Tax=Jonesia quinghaiensis TaxID=262806 RepID=UPI0004191E74|nr:FKBP-type peptidyl-prolyl cis-trans isomerase [Jonesia quinghaiensis]